MLGVEAVPLVALTSAGFRPKVDYRMTGVLYHLFDPCRTETGGLLSFISSRFPRVTASPVIGLEPR